MTVSELANLPGIKAVWMPDGDRRVEGVYIGDLLSWVMGRAQSGDAWITIMSNRNTVAVAALADTACILLAEEVQPDADALEAAKARGINILSADSTAYALAGLLGDRL